MGNHTAEAGIAAGLFLLIADLMTPEMKPNIFASGLFLIGLLCIGGSLDVWYRQKHNVAGMRESPQDTNTVGNIPNNHGIITQGQTGDNDVK